MIYRVPRQGVGVLKRRYGLTISRVKERLHQGFHRIGYDVIRYTPSTFHNLRRSRLIRTCNVDLVLDAGANTGQYAKGLRENYTGRIVSFEPLSMAFKHLRAAAASDSKWQCLQIALGEVDGSAIINIAANSVSSSLLPILAKHIRVAPRSVYVGSETVSTRSLDSLIHDGLELTHKTLLKMDVQGFELAVLRGAQNALATIPIVEIELSLVALYDGQPLFDEIYQHLRSLGFSLASLGMGLVDPNSGAVLQLDGIFVNQDLRRELQ
jgi:FkbM family methyltransferase